MPVTSDEESSKNQTRTDVHTMYLDEEIAHLAHLSGTEMRQDALGNVIQNTITSDSANFPQFILKTLKD